jgi:hypothetical protein
MIFPTMVVWCSLSPPRVVFSPEPPIHARIEALEQFNRNTRFLLLNQGRLSAIRSACPARDGCRVHDIGCGNGGWPTVARRREVMMLGISTGRSGQLTQDHAPMRLARFILRAYTRPLSGAR